LEPQQNVVMARQFTVVVNQVNAMMIVLDIDELTRHKLWAETLICANATESVTIVCSSVSAQKYVMGIKPNLLAYLVQWG
jgi:hypothetical protein